jgi:hypothetical protein
MANCSITSIVEFPGFLGGFLLGEKARGCFLGSYGVFKGYFLPVGEGRVEGSGDRESSRWNFLVVFGVVGLLPCTKTRKILVFSVVGVGAIGEFFWKTGFFGGNTSQIETVSQLCIGSWGSVFG